MVCSMQATKGWCALHPLEDLWQNYSIGWFDEFWVLGFVLAFKFKNSSRLHSNLFRSGWSQRAALIPRCPGHWLALRWAPVHLSRISLTMDENDVTSTARCLEIHKLSLILFNNDQLRLVWFSLYRWGDVRTSWAEWRKHRQLRPLATLPTVLLYFQTI